MKIELLMDHGSCIDILNPFHEDIRIETIARGLSRAPRWRGMTTLPYSVAQHCLIASAWAERLGQDPLAALLHDASETYLGDIATPVKRHMALAGKPVEDVEARCIAAIAKAFNCDSLSTGVLPEWLKEIDQALLCEEYVNLLDVCVWWEPELPEGFTVTKDMAKIFKSLSKDMKPKVAEAGYLARFKELTSET